MDTVIDPQKGYVTLKDGTVWQVLDGNGEYDDAATAAAIDAYLEADSAA
jgi:hypothetical protein